MMRSLFAGVSGLRNHQVRMDVIGNNVANVNTTAFKSSRVTFKEGFAQILQGGSRPLEASGGTNPMQVGIGMQVGSIDTLFTQGNIESTGNKTDLAIQGNAFFAVARNGQQFFTRAGNFQLDGEGRLVSPSNGAVVQGRLAKDGQLLDQIGDIKIPFGQKAAAKATSKMTLTGNLDGSAKAFTGDIDKAADRENPENKSSYTTTALTAYDSLGRATEVKVVLWKTSEGWNWKATGPEGATGNGALTFDTNGILTAGAGSISMSPKGAAAMKINLDFGTGLNGLTQFGSPTTAVFREQDGYPMGDLQDYTIDRTGTITGSFSNGLTMILGQVAVVDFNNPGGLLRTGDNMYSATPNSGTPVVGFALETSPSMITSGALEMSNVDIAQEFTNMIIAQRGFQANSKVVTSTDEMLQEVVNLKR